jgi:hypothetical protein
VMFTAGFATQARMRAPEGAASTEAVAGVNMRVREPQDAGSVNVINGATFATGRPRTSRAGSGAPRGRR